MDFELKDGDVYIITSKVLSMYEGRDVNLDSVEPSNKAKAIAKETRMLDKKVELILEEGNIIASIPVQKFGEDYILKRSENKDHAKKALKEISSMLLTKRNGRICKGVGVDLSNSSGGRPRYCQRIQMKFLKNIPV